MTKLEQFNKRIALHSIGACPRRIAYPIFENVGLSLLSEQIKSPPNPRFWDGHVHEALVKLHLVEEGTEFFAGLQNELEVKDATLDVVGHVDGVVETTGLKIRNQTIPDGQYILEVKSASSGSWWEFVKRGYQIAFPQYYAQIQAYLNSKIHGVVSASDRIMTMEEGSKSHLLSQMYQNLPTTDHPEYLKTVPDKALIIMKNKESGELHSAIIERDEGFMTGVYKNWEEAKAQVKSNRLPERAHIDANNKECTYCEFASKCWSGAAGSALATKTTSSSAITDLTAVQIAEKYKEYLGSAKIVEGELEVLRKELEILAGDHEKVSIGPVTVTRVITKRKKLNPDKVDTEAAKALFMETTTVSHRITVTGD